MATADVIERLEAILEAERQALVEGDFERIAEVLNEKEQIVDDLDALPGDANILVPLQGKLRRNQELFDQSLTGIRNVVARLAALAQIRKTLQTYDRHGHRETLLDGEHHTLEKRA